MVISLALGIAVLAAVGVVGWRRLLAWRRTATRPGRSADTAIAVSDYGEIDLMVLRERCQCGGRFGVRGEGSRGPLRLVHLECHRCGRERVVYFDTSAVRH